MKIKGSRFIGKTASEAFKMIRGRLLANLSELEKNGWIRNPRLFGSVARKEAGLKSDIDILVDTDFETPRDWMRIIDMATSGIPFPVHICFNSPKNPAPREILEEAVCL